MFHETKIPKPGVCAIFFCRYKHLLVLTRMIQKTEPAYSYALPHSDPLKCPVGALAILLHYMFDQEKLVSRVAGWKWEDTTSWRQV